MASRSPVILKLLNLFMEVSHCFEVAAYYLWLNMHYKANVNFGWDLMSYILLYSVCTLTSQDVKLALTHFDDLLLALSFNYPIVLRHNLKILQLPCL